MTALLPLAEISWRVLDRFRFGDSFAISPHGVGIAIGYLAGAAVLIYEAKRRGIAEDRASAWVFWALIGAMVGARVFYVLGHYSEFDGIGDMLAVWRGGISLIGGIFGSLIFTYPVIRRTGVPWLRATDTAAIGLPLGIVIGRIGDLVIGDHLGKPTSWALAFVYRGGNLSGYSCASGDVCRIALSGGHTEIVTPAGAQLFRGDQLIAQGAGVHQTALYDFLSTMVLVALLIWLSRRPRRDGVLFLIFAGWYAGGRVVTDFLRIDKQWFGLTGSQWASVGVLLACLVTLAVFALRPLPATPQDVLEPTPPSQPSSG
ncbi:MAG TPA: prolipoprotein diacylglyceryl transferase family protein [Actinomycetota bacterium]|nr:prolipoprotein diacylglyceryl transferase family protein [Actinomycetota bacterium]